MKPSDVAQLYQRTGLPCPPEFRDVKAAASKMGNVKKVVDGIAFASSLEAQAYQILRLWERSGAIEGLEMQPRYTLQPGFRDERTGRKVRAIEYRADFRFFDRKRGQRIVDVKGHLTAVFRIKAKLFRDRFPALNLELWDKHYIRGLFR